MSKNLQIFSLSESEYLAASVAACLEMELAQHEERSFEDREYKLRPLEKVRGKDVYILQSLFGGADLSPQDKLCRLIFFIGAIKDAGAARITAVVPYLCYARKDRRTKPMDPLNIRYIAEMLESVGLDRIVTLEVHNLQAFENAFRIPTEHLQATPLFVEWLKRAAANQEVAIVSPDIGGVKRAELVRGLLEQSLERPVTLGIMEKYRSMGKVSGSFFIGDVQNKIAMIYDDILSSGTTLVRATTACLEHGATEVHVAVTHGLFIGDAWQKLDKSGIRSIVVTDSVLPMTPRTKTIPLHCLQTGPLISRAILALHRDEMLIK